jgi:hypothetical protein
MQKRLEKHESKKIIENQEIDKILMGSSRKKM